MRRGEERGGGEGREEGGEGWCGGEREREGGGERVRGKGEGKVDGGKGRGEERGDRERKSFEGSGTLAGLEKHDEKVGIETAEEEGDDECEVSGVTIGRGFHVGFMP